MKTRLNKFLSQAGVVSRREADRLIREGRIEVNGQPVLDLGHKIDPEQDVVSVDGRKIRKQDKFIYVILNKPAGYLVTLKDPLGRPLVRDLLPPHLGRLFPVGRLDYESRGLLLLTNDGELTFRLTHPRYEIKKAYLVKVSGEPNEESLSRLEKGVLLEGRKTAPAQVSLLRHSPKTSLLRVEIHEGRKREIRRMIEMIGHRVIELERIEFAGLTLRGLKPGQWRYLRAGEVRKLKQAVRRPGD